MYPYCLNAAFESMEFAKRMKGLDGGREEGGVRWRGHLLAMFPTLCDCVCVAEQDLRELLSGVLHQVANELGLQQSKGKVPAGQHEAASNHTR